MTDIFLSYSRHDKELVTDLANCLQESGHSVWWDHRVNTGEYFDRAIERKIADCKVVLVVWSRNSVESNWCRAEAASALELRKLLPVSIDRTQPPLQFRNIQTADFRQWDRTPSHKLFHTLLNDLTRFGVSLRDPTQRHPTKGTVLQRLSYRRTALIVSGLAVVLATSVFVFVPQPLKLFRPSSWTFNSSSPVKAFQPIWPVLARIKYDYGPKNDGIDLALPEGVPVRAAESGTVLYAGDELNRYGNLVVLKHSEGLTTAYGNLSEIKVKRGDSVNQRDVLGLSGQDKNYSEPLLHFEIRRDGKAVDPLKELAANPSNRPASFDWGVPERKVAPYSPYFIMQVQRALSEMGYGQINPTGVATDATRQGIERLQRERKLPVTGTLNPTTISELEQMIGRTLPRDAPQQ